MIEIRVVSRSGVPLERLSLGAPLKARFGEAVGDIGRGADCTLVLPDPERQISRRQVLITSRGDHHFICPIGSNLIIELDGRPLAPDVESALEAGAAIRIGPYLLSVEAIAAPTAVEETAAAPEDRRLGPGDDDPLALFGQQKAVGGSVFRDLLDTPTSTDAAQKATPAAQDKADQKKGKAAPASAGATADATGRSGLGEPVSIAPRKSTRRTRAAAGSARPTAGSVKKTQSTAPEDLVSVLFSSLGVPAPVDPAQRAAQVRLVGQMLRTAIGGTLELLSARTIAKRELGENATLLQVRENNPLKFSPDTNTALARLLSPPERGFIEPLEAVRDAFGDLHAHQLAMLTGMRAALDEVLARFEPATLEPRLVPDAIWDKLVPVNRKAKLWEQYCQQYVEILREIEGDFDTMFGRAFLQAYRAQLVELARSKRSDATERS